MTPRASIAMNLLVDKLPAAVRLGGREAPVRTDFRVFVLFEMLLADESVPEAAKAPLALRYFYPELPEGVGLGEAVERMLWFYRGGEEPEPSAGAGPRPYSFECDDALIVAAFYERFHIDLTAQDLHWWLFRALLGSLLSGHTFGEVARCRVASTAGMDPGEKRYVAAMKRLYAIPGTAKRPASCASRNEQMRQYVEKRFGETGGSGHRRPISCDWNGVWLE